VTVAAFLLVLAGTLIAGRSLGRLLVGAEDGPAFRAALWLAAGLVALHVVLAWLDLAAVAWHPLAVAGVVAAGALACRRWVGPPPPSTAARWVAPAASGGSPRSALAGSRSTTGHHRSGLDWATLTGAATVAYFAVLAVSQRIAFPDFVYHWGIKGHRYFLARGIDYDFLGRDWNLVAHRDYPQLVPELYALQSSIAGRFSEPMLLAWSAVFFAALLAAARAALDAWAVRERGARVAFALLALAIGVFAVGHLLAGSTDWLVAFTLTAALPAVIRPPSARGELQLGVLAALAASTKLEGIPLAAILIGAGLWKRARGWHRGGAGGEAGSTPARVSLQSARAPSALDATRVLAGAALRLAVPVVLAVTPWLVQGLRHDLFRDPQSGAFEARRAPAIAAAVWQAMLRPEWHLAPLVLLLLPLLFARRETRLAGAIVALQLGGYLMRYFTASFDYEFSVLSSFPRLVFHVLPAVVVGLTVVGDRWALASAARPRAKIRSAVP
jgi:hypothetical protein